MKRYIVTGITVKGQRFRRVYGNGFFAMGINLYRGSVWVEENGKRKLLKRVD